MAKNVIFGVENPRCHTALIIYCVSFTSRRLLLVEAFIVSPHFVRDKLLHFALLPHPRGGHPLGRESKTREAFRPDFSVQNRRVKRLGFSTICYLHEALYIPGSATPRDVLLRCARRTPRISLQYVEDKGRRRSRRGGRSHPIYPTILRGRSP